MSSKRIVQVLTDPTLEKHLQGHKSGITCLSFSPDTKQLASGSKDHSLMVWTLKDNLRGFRYFGHKDVVTDVCFSPVGQLLASSSFDRTVRLWVPTVRGDSAEFQAHTRVVRSVHFSHDGSSLVTASDDKSVKEWAVLRKKFVTAFSGHKNWVKCARFSHDSNMIGSASDDKCIKLFDRRTGNCTQTFTEIKGCPQKVAFHPFDICIAAALTNNSIKLYDLRFNKQLQLYKCHEAEVNSVEFHSSGNYLYSVSNDSTIKILDLLEGRPIYTLKGHEGPLFDVVASAGGEYFASGGSDRQVLVWKANFINLETTLGNDSSDENNLTHQLSNFKTISNAHSSEGTLIDPLNVYFNIRSELNMLNTFSFGFTEHYFLFNYWAFAIILETKSAIELLCHRALPKSARCCTDLNRTSENKENIPKVISISGEDCCSKHVKAKENFESIYTDKINYLISKMDNLSTLMLRVDDRLRLLEEKFGIYHQICDV